MFSFEIGEVLFLKTPWTINANPRNSDQMYSLGLKTSLSIKKAKKCNYVNYFDT